MPKPDQQFKIIGKNLLRPDATDKVTGKALFGDDVRLPATLHMKVLRSPHAHARIKSLDVSEALKVPGVHAAATWKDFPPLPPPPYASVAFTNHLNARENVLASHKVIYRGQPVAALCADNAHIAEEALAKIKVEYEPLKAVMNALDAIKPDSTPIHESYTGWTIMPAFKQVSPNAFHMQQKYNDIEQGFKEADVIVERDYDTATVHQGYIEPTTCLVEWKKDGSIDCWTTSQAPYFYREQLASILEVPQHKIKVTTTEVGGGFGGKEIAYLEPAAAILSKKTGHPVRATMTRAEVFTATGPGCGSHMKIKIGAKKDGTMMAAYAFLAFEGGAWLGSPVLGAAALVFGRYKIPHQLVDAYDVIVNKPKTNAYRAPGATQAHFSAESAVDELAEKLKMDPIELRLKNCVREGDRNVQGVAFQRIGSTEVLEAMKAHPHYKAPLKGPNRGRGVALGLWRNGGSYSSASLTVNADGTAHLMTGSPDLSGTRTAIGMIAAETLGIPFENMKLTIGDTDSIAASNGSWGSRVVYATGWAAHNCAVEVNKQMSARAAKIWGVQPDDVELKAGQFTNKKDSKQSLNFKQLAALLPNTGGPITVALDIDQSGGVGPAFAGLLVDVHVDPETGKVQIERCTVVQDVSKAIHPDLYMGQMQGGTVQALGWALNEEYYYDDTGRMANPTLLDYRMPVSLDMPPIDGVIVECWNPGHPYGVRGVGENNIIAPPAALANAVYHATGVRVTTLPLSPTNVLKALWAAGKSR